jgi:REP element-mobilizing transposase RayT
MTHNRHSIRLKDYDYSQAGAYFVTICVQNRECLLGEVVDNEMTLNDAGQMVERWWGELPNKFPSIELDACVVMPNHFHGIIVLTDVGGDLCVAPGGDVHESGQTRRSAPTRPTLPQIVQWFKTMTASEYIRGVKQNSWPAFDKHFWQRNYYEHIVRDGPDLTNIRSYITNNPLQWAFDTENPNHVHPTRSRLPAN